MAVKRKRFFTSHSKSSAAVVSIALHLVLLLIAGTFVAVTVITKEDQKFESKQVVRPKMPPRKLQVPVKIKRQKRKPKLRKRIVVKTNVRNMPDIKMPEISGIKGGLGAVGGAGLGDASSIGFNMPEINLFGVKSKGEKVFIALDSDKAMLNDKLGGVLAYRIIKDELAKIIEGLGPTTLFNLAVFDLGSAVALFPKMVPATRENKGKVEAWLAPLNEFVEGRDSKAYGAKTLGKGGTPLKLSGDLADGALRGGGIQHWCRPAAKAMMEQADSVFILTGWWGTLRSAEGGWPEWPEANRRKWNEYIAKAKEDHGKENERRAAKGKPPQVIRDDYSLMATYYPKELAKYKRPEPVWHWFAGKEYAEALHAMRKEHAPRLPAKSGLTRKKDRFSINVIYFAPEGGAIHGYFVELAKRCHGKTRTLTGLEAIEDSVSD